MFTARLGIQAAAAVLAGQEMRSPSFKKVGRLGTSPARGLGECPQSVQWPSSQSGRAEKPQPKGSASNAVPGSIEIAIARFWQFG